MPWFSKQQVEYKPPHMSDAQMDALERFIAASSNASEFAKKVIIWTLRQTQNLTRPVALSIWDKDSGPNSSQVQNAAHNMDSVNGKTRIDLFFGGMGTEMRLGHHCGCFEERDGDPFNAEADGCTIWFAYIFYDRNVTRLEEPSLAELEAMVLPK